MLAEHGIDPAPICGNRLPWKEFLAAHAGAIAAADFFSVEVLRLGGLVRHSILFVIDVQTRVVTIAGIHTAPYGRWMAPIARNLTEVEGFLTPHRFLILDDDPVFTTYFRNVLRNAGVNPLRLPARSPQLECLRRKMCARSSPSA